MQEYSLFNIWDQHNYSPSATKQKHFFANNQTGLSTPWTRCFSFRIDQVPHIICWIKAVEIIEMSVEDTIIPSKDVNHIVVDNCKRNYMFYINLFNEYLYEYMNISE